MLVKELDLKSTDNSLIIPLKIAEDCIWRRKQSHLSITLIRWRFRNKVVDNADAWLDILRGIDPDTLTPQSDMEMCVRLLRYLGNWKIEAIAEDGFILSIYDSSYTIEYYEQAEEIGGYIVKDNGAILHHIPCSGFNSRDVQRIIDFVALLASSERELYLEQAFESLEA